MTAIDDKGRPLDGLEAGFGYPAGMTAGKDFDDMPADTIADAQELPTDELAADLDKISRDMVFVPDAAKLREAARRLRAAFFLEAQTSAGLGGDIGAGARLADDLARLAAVLSENSDEINTKRRIWTRCCREAANLLRWRNSAAMAAAAEKPRPGSFEVLSHDAPAAPTHVDPFRRALEWIAAHKLTAEGAKPKNAHYFRDAIVVEARQALEDAEGDGVEE